MLRGKEMIGMPVVTEDTGDEIGNVKDVIVHRLRKCVVGFLVRRNGWFQHARVLPFSEVLSIDDGTVLISSAESLHSHEKAPDEMRLLERKPLPGSTLISTNGHEIGRIGDFYFDEESGELDGFEVVAGFANDSAAVPEFLPLDDDIFVGKYDVIVSEQAVDRLMYDATEDERPAPIVKDVLQSETKTKPVNNFTTAHAPPLHSAPPTEPDPDLLKMTVDGTAVTIGFQDIDVPDELSIARYREQILRMLAERTNCTKLSFDIGKFKYLPSAMLGLLASLRKKVENVEILNPSLDALDAIKMLGFDKFMTIR